jgi:putative GTP pyrophosphokinase
MAKIKNKGTLRREYHEKLELFSRLKEAAKGDIEEILKQNKVINTVVLGRVKSFDSFSKKAQEGLNTGKFTNPIDEIHDLVGIRAVLVFIDDLEKVPDLLVPTFKILEVERKGTNHSEDTFGYESDHYILQYDKVEGPRYANLKNCSFELQVRTILMDAWASLSHEIEYKTNGAIPSNLKRTFFGLSGMFVVADKTFQDLRNASKENQEKLLEKSMTFEKILNQEINLDTLKTYLLIKFSDRAKREFSKGYSDEEYSDFIEEIKAVGGYTLIKDIDEAVETAGELEATIEGDLRLNSRTEDDEIPGEMHIVGSLRAIFDLYDDKYFERVKDFEFTFWAQKIKETKVLLSKRKERK